MLTKLFLIFTSLFLIVSASEVNYAENIKNHVDELKKGDSIKTLQNWIQQKSFSGDELKIQEIMKKELTDLGLEVDMYEMDLEEMKKNEHFQTRRESFKNSPNIVAILKGTGHSEVTVDIHGKQQEEKKYPSIILNGHVDVVPEGEKKWEDDPFSGKIKNGKIFGRGSTDMKGGIFSSYLALKILKDLNIKLKGDVIFQSVVEEEAGGAGTLSTVLRGYKADAAIIPEPTNMKIFPKQQVAHGGTRYEGVSAIEKSMLVIKKIQELEQTRTERIKKEDPLFAHLPIPIPINIGKIFGGQWSSSVADQVTLEGRLGISPSETMEEARNQLREALLTIDDDWIKANPVKLEFWGAHWLPGGVDVSHEIVKTLSSSFETVMKKQPIIEASPWGTDGGYLTQYGTPAIVFGPGVTSSAHQKDEYIEIEKIYQCAEILALTLIKWCKV